MLKGQSIDDWQNEQDNRKALGDVLLVFSTPFNVIDHSLLLGKLKEFCTSLLMTFL